MSNDEIDAGPPPAVSSLRSKFEQLAHSNDQAQPVPSGSRSRPTSYIRSTTPVPRAPTPTPPTPTPTPPHSAAHPSTDQSLGNNNNNDFLHPYHARAGSTVSLTSSNGDAGLLPPPLPARGRAGSDVSSTASDDVHHLRNVSSSGDLKRRPPPPPPMSHGRSPGTSPLMRADGAGGSAKKGALPLPDGFSLDNANGGAVEEHLSVKDMRNRFNGYVHVQFLSAVCCLLSGFCWTRISTTAMCELVASVLTLRHLRAAAARLSSCGFTLGSSHYDWPSRRAEPAYPGK